MLEFVDVDAHVNPSPSFRGECFAAGGLQTTATMTGRGGVELPAHLIFNNF